jgi:hypothetical protein
VSLYERPWRSPCHGTAVSVYPDLFLKPHYGVRDVSFSYTLHEMNWGGKRYIADALKLVPTPVGWLGKWGYMMFNSLVQRK